MYLHAAIFYRVHSRSRARINNSGSYSISNVSIIGDPNSQQRMRGVIMSLNYNKMKKAELLWMCNHKCRTHSVRYIEHPGCYEKECPDGTKVGIVDIEASNLKADFGVVLCYAILDLNTDELISRIATKKELFDRKHQPDYGVMRDFCIDVRKFDRLVGYYSADGKFDIPFLRSRAVAQDLHFPGYGEVMMEDVWPIIRYKFCLSSNRLANASRFLVGHSDKTNWFAKYWIRAIQGDKEALKYIKDHCERDVRDTKKLYLKVSRFKRQANTSI
jgi:uncharacterized protein YprB with RNaseH-like and TPR domain